MELLLLLIIVPTVVVPVVLLFGFSGCEVLLGIGDPKLVASVPTNLHARLAASRKSVDLTWLPSGGEADSFEIRRSGNDGSNKTFSSQVATMTDGADLAAGVTYDYSVKAVQNTFATDASSPASVTIPPAAPSLTAVPEGPGAVRLNWTPSPQASKYRLEHPPDTTPVFEGAATSALHPVPTGVQHSYRVIAIVEDGRDDSIKKPVESDPSPTVQITLTPGTGPNWVSIFPTTAGIAPNPNNGVDVAGDCIVQRIRAPASGGTQFRVTLRGIPNQATTLTAVTISRAAPAGAAQPQNSVDAPVSITFGGAAGVTLPINGAPQTSDPVNYTVAAGQDLHVAFNVSPASGRIQRKPRAGEQAYRKNDATEAALVVRPPTYNANNNVDVVYCIETIEVA
jgi:hypothetical protein